MATTHPVVKLTYEDYRSAPGDERCELLDGDLVMVAAPNLKHQKVQLEPGARNWASSSSSTTLGEFFFAPCDVVLSDTDVVQPDLLFVSREREHLLSGGENVQGAPDLVIEILSPATADRDRGYKHELYGRCGVTEYWLVDPIAESDLGPSATRAASSQSTRTFSREQTLRSRAAPRPGTPARGRLLVLTTSQHTGSLSLTPRRPTHADARLAAPSPTGSSLHQRRRHEPHAGRALQTAPESSKSSRGASMRNQGTHLMNASETTATGAGSASTSAKSSPRGSTLGYLGTTR